MRNLFTHEDNAATRDRLAGLASDTKPLWGKLDAAGMCAHCAVPMRAAIGEATIKGNIVLRLFGRMMKRKVLADEPFKKNLPTAANFIVATPRSFAEERDDVAGLIERFDREGHALVENRAHPFFGPLTPPEWGALMWKHVDHHLRQFGV